MTEFAGLLAFVATTWAALMRFDFLQHRRRIAAWSERAERIRHMKGTT